MRAPGGADTRSEKRIRRSQRRRIAAFLVAALVTVAFVSTALWTAGALRAVDVVEAERDRWQRPGDVMEALDFGEGTVVADLGSNTFHELEDVDRVLAHARDALRRGGRLVVVDPGSPVADEGSAGAGLADATSSGHGTHHHTSPDQAAARILHAGLEIVRRDDAFVDEPGHGRWWLIVARRL